MKCLKGKSVLLRALEPTDLEILYQWENDPEVWTISNTQTPYSKYMLKKFIDASVQDIYTSKQLRLMMEEIDSGKVVGIFDFFDYEPFHGRIGVGILIDKDFRQKGYAKEGLRLIKDYAFNVLRVHQIYCNVLQSNEISLNLFQQEGFTIAGIKKEWVKTEAGWEDEALLQIVEI